MRSIIGVFYFLSACFFSVATLAQGKAESGGEYFAEIGNILPDQITGVQEILPVWGAGFGWHSGSSTSSLELLSARGEGTIYNGASLSFRSELPLSTLIGTISAGVDGHWYQRPFSDHRTAYMGVHVGGGVMIPVSSGLYARLNMRFSAPPGVAMILGFGLVYRPEEDP